MSLQAGDLEGAGTDLALFPFNNIAQIDAETARFDFQYRHLSYFAELRQQSNGPAQLHLTTRIGEIPFTVQGPQLRTNILAILQATKFVETAKFEVDLRQEIVLKTTTSIAPDATATEILTQIIKIVSCARPYIDLLHTMMPLPCANNP